MYQVLLTEPEKCNGCGSCMRACATINGPSAITIKKLKNGHSAIVCQHCVDANCAKGCFNESIEIEDNGLVKLDSAGCAGCKICMLMCPIGAIKPTDNGVFKCNQQCITKENTTPACVSACKKKCLKAIDIKEHVKGKQKEFIDKPEVQEKGDTSEFSGRNL